MNSWVSSGLLTFLINAQVIALGLGELYSLLAMIIAMMLKA